MPQLRLFTRLASAFTTPRSPEDFLRLIDPLASARQLRGLVTAVVPETADSVTIRFRPGKGWNAHEAGQWARIGVEVDGVRHWRSYSLSTGAGQDPAITVTAMGKVSTALVRGTRPGDVLFLAPPEGDFVLPESPRPLLMLTAGSGLTPAKLRRMWQCAMDYCEANLFEPERVRIDSGSVWIPPLASVEYAEASSSGVTSKAPSASEGTASSWLSTTTATRPLTRSTPLSPAIPSNSRPRTQRSWTWLAASAASLWYFATSSTRRWRAPMASRGRSCWV